MTSSKLVSINYIILSLGKEYKKEKMNNFRVPTIWKKIAAVVELCTTEHWKTQFITNHEGGKWVYHWLGPATLFFICLIQEKDKQLNQQFGHSAFVVWLDWGFLWSKIKSSDASLETTIPHAIKFSLKMD
jgi:hypothetical protein